MSGSTQSHCTAQDSPCKRSLAAIPMHSTCLLRSPPCCTRLTDEPERNQRAPVIVHTVEQRQVGDVVHVCLAGAVPLHKRALVRHVGEVWVTLRTGGRRAVQICASPGGLEDSHHTR